MTWNTQEIAGPGFRALASADNQTKFTLELAGKVRLELGCAVCGKFSENTALPKKLRKHNSHDGLLASFESASTIPFGCEYNVEREIELFDGIGLLTTDLAAVNRGLVGDINLGDVRFPGPWRKIAFLLPGEVAFTERALDGDETELYRGSEPPVMVRLDDGAGTRIEFATGSDLWRHRSGSAITGCSAEFALTGNTAGVTLTRQVLRFAEDAVIEKRPWRFKNLIAWETPGRASAETPARTVDFAAAQLPPAAGKDGGATPCMSSSGARKFLRDAVRRGGESLLLTNIAPGFCRDAAHLERAGKSELLHLDLEDFAAFYLWGNRQLARSGATLRMTPQPGTLFADSVAAVNLGRAPQPLA